MPRPLRPTLQRGSIYEKLSATRRRTCRAHALPAPRSEAHHTTPRATHQAILLTECANVCVSSAPEAWPRSKCGVRDVLCLALCMKAATHSDTTHLGMTCSARIAYYYFCRRCARSALARNSSDCECKALLEAPCKVCEKAWGW